jgi:GTP-binding protein EngB required for normal cell division
MLYAFMADALNAFQRCSHTEQFATYSIQWAVYLIGLALTIVFLWQIALSGRSNPGKSSAFSE